MLYQVSLLLLHFSDGIFTGYSMGFSVSYLLFLSPFRILLMNLSTCCCVTDLFFLSPFRILLMNLSTRCYVTDLFLLSSFRILLTNSSTRCCVSDLFLLSSFWIETGNSVRFCISLTPPFFATSSVMSFRDVIRSLLEPAATHCLFCFFAQDAAGDEDARFNFGIFKVKSNSAE